MATTGTPRKPAQGGPTAPRPPARNGNGKGRGRPAPRRRHPVWRAIAAFFQILTLLIVVPGITIMAWAYWRLSTAPKTIDLPETPLGITYVYSSDGTPLAEYFTERRKVVPIEDIPKNLQNATVAFEDRRFYAHGGVDLQGIGRAIYSNLRHQDIKGEGGSTITQQLARNLGVGGLTRQKSLGRKFNELIIAQQIENGYTKQDILAKYLNQINYGSGAYGVEAAAEVYFNKHVRQLDLAQCALLAGLPNRPNDFSPYNDIVAAQGQRNRVLDQMLKEHYITPAQYAQAVKEKIKLAGAKPTSQGSQIFHAPYFVNYVVDQIRRKYGPDYITNGNLKIYTTLNWPMQQKAEQAVREGIARVRGLGPNQAALVCLDPKTGEIKAMVGGVDYKKSQFNIAAQARRQPGSSFKAVVYSAAINDGSVLESGPHRTMIYDGPVSYPSSPKPYTPKDDNGYSYRKVDLREAMAQSINVPAVKVLHLIGPQAAIRYARMMGIHSPLDPVPSLALGSSGVTPLEMASVYSTFPAGGNHPEPSGWTRLTDAQDNVLEDVPPAIETRVLQKETVAQLDDMLRAVVTEGTGRSVGELVPDARGKTGTTQGHKDVWFVGYTPELVCAVWAGHPIYKSKNLPPAYGEEMEGNAWGATVCAPIWAQFMSQALPIFKAATAREVARAKAKLPPVAKPVTNADTAAAVEAAPSDSASDSSPTDTPRPSRRAHRSQPHDNGDGTETVIVDDNSSLLAPEGAPNSHPETFTTGTAPTTLSPQYTNPQPIGDAGRADSGSSGASSSPSDSPSDSSDTSRSRRHRRHDAGSDTVSVTVNPEDGLLATRWDPQTVTRTYPRGQEPHRYSRMYPPPPGER